MENYNHHFAAHCESGVTTAIFENSEDIKISEPMAFGIGSGIFFMYIPFFKVMGNPVVSYRSFPGSIFKKCCKRLSMKYKMERFRNPTKGVERLNLLLKDKIVGIQTNIYWLSYIPKKFRFHFNAHNLIVLDKKDDEYTVSDPLLEAPAKCSTRSMLKARFSKGPLSPKGLLYYLDGSTTKINYEKAVRQSIKESIHRMLFIPIPYFGISAIKLLSKDIKKWGAKLSKDKANSYLSSVIRMQEEIGTGGSGFRYIYASFLQESGKKLQNQTLIDASIEMESIADMWRDFATLGIKVCRGKSDQTFNDVAEFLLNIYQKEKSFYKNLKKNF